jgi:hypothetical protein
MNPKAREHRFRRLKEIGCWPCNVIGFPEMYPEIHHLNEDGKAGQERRGDEFTVPLCPWHHRGVCMQGYVETQMLLMLGPSLKLHSRLFRERFGTDDVILAKVDAEIARRDRVAFGWKDPQTEAERMHE